MGENGLYFSSFLNQSDSIYSVLNSSETNLYENMTTDFRNTTLRQRKFNLSATTPALMFAAGVFGNVLALVVLLRSPTEQKRTVFYRLVGGLTVTDLFGTCATSPVILFIYSNQFQWVGGMHLCNYFAFMMVFVGLATIFVLGAMATDRYLALNKPYFYSAKVTVSKIKYILVSLWFAAFSIACLPLMGVGEFIIQIPGTWCFFNFYGTTARVKSFAYLYSIVGISVVLTIAVLNMIVVKTLIKMNSTTRLQKRRGSIIVRCMDAEIQMAMFLVGILAVFSTCWAPFMVRILLIQTGLFPGDRRLDLLLVRFASFNQILDPWVYILFRKSLFTRIQSILKTVVCRSGRKVSKNHAESGRPPITITTENMVSMDMSDYCCSSPARKQSIPAEESLLPTNT